MPGPCGREGEKHPCSAWVSRFSKRRHIQTRRARFAIRAAPPSDLTSSTHSLTTRRPRLLRSRTQPLRTPTVDSPQPEHRYKRPKSLIMTLPVGSCFQQLPFLMKVLVSKKLHTTILPEPIWFLLTYGYGHGAPLHSLIPLHRSWAVKSAFCLRSHPRRSSFIQSDKVHEIT